MLVPLELILPLLHLQIHVFDVEEAALLDVVVAVVVVAAAAAAAAPEFVGTARKDIPLP